MADLATEFRRRAEEISAAADVLLASPEFLGDPKRQATAIIGKVNASTYSALAETVAYLEALHFGKSTDERIEQLRDRTSRLRLAAARGFASGDWGEFNAVVGIGEDAGRGTTTESGGAEAQPDGGS